MLRIPDGGAAPLQADVWHAGHDRSDLQAIFASRAFMNELHIHGFANRMQRHIINIDERGPRPHLFHYQPGYTTQSEISVRAAKDLRANAHTLGKPISWILLSTGHFSALRSSAGTLGGGINFESTTRSLQAQAEDPTPLQLSQSTQED